MKFSFDILFMAIIAASSVGCFLLGEEKAQRLMIGVLVGILASTQLSEPISSALKQKTSVLSGSNVSIVLLVLPIVLCVIGKNVRNSKFPKSKIKALIAGFISGFAALGYAIAGLNKGTRTGLITDHNLAAMAYDLRYIALGLLILWLMIMYLTVGKAKR